MSYYNTLISVWPAIPPCFLGGVSGWLLNRMLVYERDEEGNVFFKSEDTVDHSATFDGGLVNLLQQASEAHPLKKLLMEITAGLEEEEEFEFEEISVEEALQGIIFESKNAIRWFEVEAALVASYVQPGQVGGWCSFVTAETIKHKSTGSWLMEQRRAIE